MTATLEEPEVQSGDAPLAPARQRSDALAAVSASLVQQAPRAISPMQVQGFLSTVQAHPSFAAADDYARRKTEQAARMGQRVEQQFWEGVRSALQKLAGPEGSETRQVATLVRRFAQHLAADNAWRLAQQIPEGGPPGGSGPRRGGAGARPRSEGR